MAKLFKRYGWILALLVVLLLVVFAVIVIINKSVDETNNSTNDKLIQKEKVDKPSDDSTVQKKLVEDSAINGDEAVGSDVGSNEVSRIGSDLPNLKNDTDGTLVTKKLNSEQDNRDSDIEQNNPESKRNSITPTVSSVPELKTHSKLRTEFPSVLESSKKSLVESLNKSETQNSILQSADDKLLKNKKDKRVKVDIIRVDNVGDALVAGRTEPNTTVEVLSNDDVIGSVESDDEGEFVIMGSLQKSKDPQTITVRSNTENVETNESSEPISNIEKRDTETKELIDKNNWVLAEEIFVVLPVSIKSGADPISKNIEAPVIVQSSSSDIKIVQNKDFIPIKEVIIDSISYSDIGEAVLVGRANPSNKIFVYLDNVLKASSEVGAFGGWTTELTGLEPGLYELRLDEVDPSGMVKSRIMTPFKKESKDFLLNMVSGSITVQTGNSLWRIARRIFGKGIRYIEIYKKNSDLIKNPDLIYPGQVFSIPTDN